MDSTQNDPNQNEQTRNIIDLPRGGYIVPSSIGGIQFGAPPETIKDSMGLEGGVPRLFVLPKHFFNWVKGISVAEVEFPIYYNFFIRKQKTFLLCEEDQYKRFLTVLHESLFGPKNLQIFQDYVEDVNPEVVPALRKEMAYFRNNMKLSDLVSFVIFQNGRVSFKGITIEEGEEHFQVYEGEDFLAEVPRDIKYNPTYDIGERLAEPFDPPVFGVTCLGPSHGFDPTENTSGFIIWLNHRGIMVDPPVNSTEWLIDSHVSPKLIDSVILTHCHADHDAGTLQKILEEGRINVYTTRTIMGSFLRKYGALAGVSEEYLQKLFHFHPVRIGEPVFIHCGRFEFQYSLHSIPTVGFRLSYGDRSMVYSSDHNNDPELHRKLRDQGVLSPYRYRQLSAFPWDSDLIYHEAGIPPLHTPVDVLNSQPEEIKKKIVVYHIAEKDFPADTSLRLAQFGIQHTITLPVEPPPHKESYQVMGLLDYLDYFKDLPISKAQEFLTIVQKEEFSRGDTIIQKGTPGDRFYIIRSGDVSVLGEDLEKKKVYSVYDSFGEASLLTDQPRSADVVAETDVTLYSIEKEKFLHFIRNTEWERMLKRLARVRDSETWNILSSSPYFGILTSTQKTFIESLLIKADYEAPRILIAQEDPMSRVYILRRGTVDVYRDGEKRGELGRGDLVGSMVKVYQREKASCSYRTRDAASLYALERKDVLTFLENNPGMIMKLASQNGGTASRRD